MKFRSLDVDRSESVHRRRVSRDLNSERGQATVLTLGLALLCFAIAGVTVDGTRAFLMRRSLQNAADSAALAGATELDRADVYRGADDALSVSATNARRAATRWLGHRGLVADASIEVVTTEVRVRLRARLPTTFLGLVGVGELPVAVEATAGPLRGDVP
jgi:Flp pilus assembly protein TadG